MNTKILSFASIGVMSGLTMILEQILGLGFTVIRRRLQIFRTKGWHVGIIEIKEYVFDSL